MRIVIECGDSFSMMMVSFWLAFFFARFRVVGLLHDATSFVSMSHSTIDVIQLYVCYFLAFFILCDPLSSMIFNFCNFIR